MRAPVKRKRKRYVSHENEGSRGGRNVTEQVLNRERKKKRGEGGGEGKHTNGRKERKTKSQTERKKRKAQTEEKNSVVLKKRNVN